MFDTSGNLHWSADGPNMPAGGCVNAAGSHFSTPTAGAVLQQAKSDEAPSRDGPGHDGWRNCDYDPGRRPKIFWNTSMRDFARPLSL